MTRDADSAGLAPYLGVSFVVLSNLDCKQSSASFLLYLCALKHVWIVIGYLCLSKVMTEVIIKDIVLLDVEELGLQF